jgi:hypothetical protein
MFEHNRKENENILSTNEVAEEAVYMQLKLMGIGIG